MEITKIKELLINLHYEKPLEVQLDSINQLVKIDEAYLPMLLEYDTDSIYWSNIVKVLEKVGFPKIKPIIPNLIERLQDINWPGSEEIADFLVSLGKSIIPNIRGILNGNDAYWKYYTLKMVIEKWPSDIVAEITPELKKLLNEVDLENGFQIDALRILMKNELFDNKDLIRVYMLMKERYLFLINKLIDNKQYFEEK